jgi:hypothetical protein
MTPFICHMFYCTCGRVKLMEEGRAFVAGKILKALSVLLLISSSAVGQTIPASYFGMHDINAPGMNPWPLVSFGTFRLWDNYDITWSNLEPSRGTYNWASLDNYINVLNSHNVTDIIYTFGYTPSWAGASICTPPSDSDYIAFVTAIVTRYKNSIKHWETWNEPYAGNFWCGNMTQLVSLQNDLYNTVKSIDPTATVHTPALFFSMTPGVCTDIFLAANGTSNFDVLDAHLYPYTPVTAPESLGGSGGLADGLCAMNTYGISNKPLWNTEFSWGMNSWLPNINDQIAFLARSHLYLRSKGVARSYWYAYNNGGWGTIYNGTGLNTAGVAYRQVYTWMVGATMTTPCALASNVWSCDFTLANGNAGRAVWLDVFQSSATQSYTPGGTYNKYLDLAGGSTTFSSSVTISEQPILLEGTVSARPNVPTALMATVH